MSDNNTTVAKEFVKRLKAEKMIVNEEISLELYSLYSGRVTVIEYLSFVL